MRKLLSFLLIAVAFCVFTQSGGNALSQPSEEIQEQRQLMSAIMTGMMPTPIFLGDFRRGHNNLDETGDATPEQFREFSLKINEKFSVFGEEMRKKFGGPGDTTHEQLGDVAETMASVFPKANDVYREVMKETFSAEAVKRMNILSFQAYGGVFGGALNVENLAPLNLTDEQKEKAANIVEKLNRERIELVLSAEINMRSDEGQDIEAIMKETMDKLVSITRRGQNEIEALLTPEQKKRAEELMVDVPEQYRFLNDYLAKRPWRLDESSWKPGDGAPPNLENHPGEMRLERVPPDRPFPGN